MYRISTFSEEGIGEEKELIVKCLYVLAFINHNNHTFHRLQYHPALFKYVTQGKSSILYKYLFMSLVNPPGYNLIAKQLPRPFDRRSLQEDFMVIEESVLYDYIEAHNVISSTYSLN